MEDPRIRLDLPERPVEAWVDPLRIALLVRNLLSNALRHGGGAPVELSLSAGPETWRLAVTDRGEGIAPEHLARLGEPLYRPDPSRVRSTGGHGLGLYLCRQIADQHGGRLLIDSRLGEGTTVAAHLPKGCIATAPPPPP